MGCKYTDASCDRSLPRSIYFARRTVMKINAKIDFLLYPGCETWYRRRQRGGVGINNACGVVKKTFLNAAA